MRPEGFKNPFGEGGHMEGVTFIEQKEYAFEVGANEYERCLKGMSECLLGADLSKAVQIYLKVVNKRGYWVFIEESDETTE